MSYRLLYLLWLLPGALFSQKLWETSLSEPTNTRAFYTARAAPDGVYAAGYTELPPHGTARGLVNYYTDTALRWRAELPTGVPAWVTALHPTAAGVLAVLYPPDHNGFYCHLLDADGTLVDTVHVATDAPVEIATVLPDGAGGYYFGGRQVLGNRSKFFVARTGADFRIQWQRVFSSNVGSGNCTALLRQPNGDLLAGGRSGPTGLYRFGADGELRWGRTYDVRIAGLLPAAGDEFVVYGSANDLPYIGYLNAAGDTLRSVQFPAAARAVLPFGSSITRLRQTVGQGWELVVQANYDGATSLVRIGASGQLLRHHQLEEAPGDHFIDSYVPTSAGYANVGYRYNERGTPVAFLQSRNDSLNVTQTYLDGAELDYPIIRGYDLLRRPGGYAVFGQRGRGDGYLDNLHLALLNERGQLTGRLEWYVDTDQFVYGLSAARTEDGWWMLYEERPLFNLSSASLWVLQLDHTGALRVPPVRLQETVPANPLGHLPQGTKPRIQTYPDGAALVTSPEKFWRVDPTGRSQREGNFPVSTQHPQHFGATALPNGHLIVARALDEKAVWIRSYDATGAVLATRTLPGFTFRPNETYNFFGLVATGASEVLLNYQLAREPLAQLTFNLNGEDLQPVAAPIILDGLTANDDGFNYCLPNGNPQNFEYYGDKLWATGKLLYYFDDDHKAVGPLRFPAHDPCTIDTGPTLDQRGFVTLRPGYFVPGFRRPNRQTRQPGDYLVVHSLETNQRPLYNLRDTLLTVYPNPVDEWLQVDMAYTVRNTQPTTVELYDALGREVYRAEHPAKLFRLQLTVPVGHLPAGAYYLRVTAGDLRELVPVIVR